MTVIELPKEINGAIIASMEGGPIATALPGDKDKEKISAMMAALWSVAKISYSKMNKGEFDYIYIKGKQGNLLLFSININTVFAVSTPLDVNLGFVYLECKRVCKKIMSLMEGKYIKKLITLKIKDKKIISLHESETF
ncbi:MAG: roadblock/LC7 domain-containing protein [Promethearchaeota archaeon]